MSYKPTKWENRVYDEKGNIIKDGTGLWAEYLNNMEDGILRANIFVDSKGNPDGIATLDENGIVNSSQLPTNLKEMEVVHSLDDMDNIHPKFKGLRVMVIVNEKWKEFVYDGEEFIEVGSSEHLSIILDWDNIKDKPTKFEPEDHLHLEKDIKDLDKYSKEEIDNKLILKAEKHHSHDVEDISNLNVYTKDEVDSKLDKKANEEHTHKKLHEHNNKLILDKLTDLGDHNQIDLDLIYSHKHSYNDIQGRPKIPSNYSNLINDRGHPSSNANNITVSSSAPINPKENDIWIVI